MAMYQVKMYPGYQTFNFKKNESLVSREPSIISMLNQSSVKHSGNGNFADWISELLLLSDYQKKKMEEENFRNLSQEKFYRASMC